MSAACLESCMLIISKVQVDASSGSRGKERPVTVPATAETGDGCGDAPSTQFNNSTEDSRPAKFTTRESALYIFPSFGVCVPVLQQPSLWLSPYCSL